MKLAKLVLAGSLLLGATSAALAQEALTGTVTTVDRLNGTIGIRQVPSGTVGAGGGGATEQQFKAPEGTLDKLHAGDRVTYSVGDSGGKKTITKIESQ